MLQIQQQHFTALHHLFRQGARQRYAVLLTLNHVLLQIVGGINGDLFGFIDAKHNADRVDFEETVNFL
ncbi:hypothetical protein D3C76_1793640 [compost metagenome]